MTEATAITHDLALQRFSDAVRLFVGSGRRFSCAAVAEATGIPLRTVKSYLAGDATPGCHNILRLAAVLPASFINMLLEPAGIGGAHSMHVGPARPLETLFRVASEASAMAEALQDGKLDHRERLERVPHMRALASHLNEAANAIERGDIA